MLPLESPIKVYTGRDGKPLNNGKIYFGIADQNPMTAPVTVYWDREGADPAAQPLRTENGYIMRQGAPASVFYDGEYSELVLDEQGRQVLLARSSNNFSVGALISKFIADVDSPIGATLMSWIQSGAGAQMLQVMATLRESVSITQFGASTSSADNIDAIDDALAYIQLVGGNLRIPRGRWKTSGAHALTLGAGAVASIFGDGPGASILVSTGMQDVLTISGASECSVRQIGIDKETRDQTGRGLVVINTAYAVIDHVTTYGFGTGIYTEAVLTSLFTKVLSRLCGYGMFLSHGVASCPNAITLQSCSLSLNHRFGLRTDKPATLNIQGGSIEGNGWEVATFHGGVYISNAGVEGGVGVTFDGVQMEQNHGEADIYIASTTNAGTAYNIYNCSIFPIDNTHFTANRIFIENGVQQHLNICSNNFKHFGSYTPNAARKYVSVLNTALMTVNTGGDSAQFYDAIETPDLATWGANVVRQAMFSAHATVAISGAPAALLGALPYNIASVNLDLTGQVSCVFSKPMANVNYRVLATCDSGAKTTACTFKGVNGFAIQTRDLGGVLANSGFDVVVVGGI